MFINQPITALFVCRGFPGLGATSTSMATSIAHSVTAALPRWKTPHVSLPHGPPVPPAPPAEPAPPDSADD